MKRQEEEEERASTISLPNPFAALLPAKNEKCPVRSWVVSAITMPKLIAEATVETT